MRLTESLMAAFDAANDSRIAHCGKNCQPDDQRHTTRTFSQHYIFTYYIV